MHPWNTVLTGKPSGFLWSKGTSSNVLLRDSESQKHEKSTWNKRIKQKTRKGLVLKEVKGKAKSLCGKQELQGKAEAGSCCWKGRQIRHQVTYTSPQPLQGAPGSEVCGELSAHTRVVGCTLEEPMVTQPTS